MTGMDKYAVILLHYSNVDKPSIEYAEVIMCPFQTPEEAVFIGSFTACQKWANKYNQTDSTYLPKFLSLFLLNVVVIGKNSQYSKRSRLNRYIIKFCN